MGMLPTSDGAGLIFAECIVVGFGAVAVGGTRSRGSRRGRIVTKKKASRLWANTHSNGRGACAVEHTTQNEKKSVSIVSLVVDM